MPGTCDGHFDYYYQLTDTAANGTCVRAVHGSPPGGHTACGQVIVVYYGDDLSTVKVCDIASNGVLTNCSATYGEWGY